MNMLFRQTALISHKAACAFLGKFRRDESGVAAIEGAIVMTMLVGVFVAMADVSVQTSAQSRLSNALRASVQYIVNEGRDLDAAEQLFKDSYGSEDATFSLKLDCSCAKTREEYVLEDKADDTGNAGAIENDVQAEISTVDVVQADDGAWGQCTITCGSAPLIKYLNMIGSADVRTLVKNDEITVNASYSVRVE